MAPGHSKFAARTSQGPQDIVFWLATQRVRPAVEGLLAALRESAQGLLAAAEEAQGPAATRGAEAPLGSAASALRAAVRGAAEALEGCGAAVQAFLRSKKRPLHGPLPVAFTLWLLQLLYGAFVLVYMPAAGIALNSPTSLIFHALMFLTLSSFYRAATTNPGGVPQGAEWRTPSRPPPGLQERKRGTGEPRWCRHERCYKPDRAHHSSAMGRVVLRMDHHCLWMGNTVGFRNHKFFFLFLLYANAACGYFGWNIIELLVHATLPALSSFLLIGAEGLMAVLSAVLGPFFLFHCWLLLRNKTTIEVMEGHRSTEAADAEPNKADGPREAAGASPYDLGPFRNVCSVLGENPLLWLLPLGGPAGDGLSFAQDQATPPSASRAAGRSAAKHATPSTNGEFVEGSASHELDREPEADERPEAEATEPDVEPAAEATAEPAEEPASEPAAEPAAEPAEGTAETAAAIEEPPVGGNSWSSALDFVGDLGLGCRALGEAAAQTAAEAAGRFQSLCLPGQGLEQKARRNSWQRVARRSVAAAAIAAPQEPGPAPGHGKAQFKSARAT